MLFKTRKPYFKHWGLILLQVASFHHHDKTSEKANLKNETFIGSQFGLRQNMMRRKQRSDVNVMVTEKGAGIEEERDRDRETETVRESWPGTNYIFKDIYPITKDVFPATRIFLLKSPSLVFVCVLG